MKGTNHKIGKEELVSKSSDFGTLKPLGKILGNNFFTYHQPNMEELFNTLRSFPQPVFWLTSANYLKPAYLDSLGLDHSNIYIFPSDEFDKNRKVKYIDSTSLSDIFHNWVNQNAMVLISCNSKDEKLFGQTIEDTLKNLR